MVQQRGNSRVGTVGPYYICDRMGHIPRDCDQRRCQSAFPRQRGGNNNTRGGQPPKPSNKFEGQVNGMSNSLVVKGTVNGVECQCLIDTGASVSLVPLSKVSDKLIHPFSDCSIACSKRV